jgi:uncharacterized RDD family membrane protein YckC
MENTEQDLLTEETHPYLQFTHATRGQRFLNYLTDNIFMNWVVGYFTGYAIGRILVSLFPDFMYSVFYGGNKLYYYLLIYIIAIFNYLLYYTLCENFFRGYTLGKLITGTRALRSDGEELTFKNAFLRSLSRLVPFEPFSGFGVPWHDSWTNTMVVKTR